MSHFKMWEYVHVNNLRTSICTLPFLKFYVPIAPVYKLTFYFPLCLISKISSIFKSLVNELLHSVLFWDYFTLEYFNFFINEKWFT